MKRWLFGALAVCLLLSGCRLDSAFETASFYYLDAGYADRMSDPIRKEQKEITGHAGDLSYLMHLYLMGPSGEGLKSPLPGSCSLISIEDREGVIQVKLSDTRSSLTESEFSLACACLTLTILDFTQAQAVTITSGTRKVSMNTQTLTLYDSGTPAATEETQ